MFAQPAPDTEADDLRTAMSVAGEWRTAADVTERLGWPDRLVREVAGRCHDIISFPGSPGYKLLAHCTVAEFRRFVDTNRSQARKMIARTIRAEKLYHAVGTGRAGV